MLRAAQRHAAFDRETALELGAKAAQAGLTLRVRRQLRHNARYAPLPPGQIGGSKFLSARVNDASRPRRRRTLGRALERELHPGGKGYEVWAQAVKEPLTLLMAAR